MRRCFGLLSLAALAVLFSAHPCRAQDAAADVIKPYTGPPNLYAPMGPEPDLFAVLKLGPTGPPVKRGHPIYNCYLKSPFYCVTHHNLATCGSLKSECVFLFGSCRQFFGEPCFKGPDPYPHPWFGKQAGGCPSCQQ
jgi:hypothetical protein